MSYKLGINLDEMLEYLKYRIFAGRRLNEKSKTVKIETKKIWWRIIRDWILIFTKEIFIWR